MLIDEKTLPSVAAELGVGPFGYVADPNFDYEFEWRRETDGVVQVILAIDWLSTMRPVPLDAGLTSAGVALYVSSLSDYRLSNGAALIAAHLLDIPSERIKRLPQCARLAVNPTGKPRAHH